MWKWSACLVSWWVASWLHIMWMVCEHMVDEPLFCASGSLEWNWHDDVIKWKHFPRYWPFVRGIHRSPVNFPHKGQWRGVLMFPLICTRINGRVNNGEAGDLRRHRVHYDIIIYLLFIPRPISLPDIWRDYLIRLFYDTPIVCVCNVVVIDVFYINFQ